jgi:hypothetical protein
MEYLSTTGLANEMDIPTNELFTKLKGLGLIERRSDKWILTEAGKQKGGQTRINPKFGEYIVWPENSVFENPGQNSKPKFINATAIGKHFNVSSQRLNLILSELGFIKKAFIGQDVNGWTVTKFGKSIGGKQYEHETSGASYVLWPESILIDKGLVEVFHPNQTQKTENSTTQNLDQANSENAGDYREKFEAKHRTLDGHYVRSRAEVIIDNTLYQYGLVHAYERKIMIGNEEVISDFYLPEGKVYIEFWGMENDPKYSERKKRKIEFYRKNEIPLIELHDSDILSLDDHLPRKLKDFNIKVY